MPATASSMRLPFRLTAISCLLTILATLLLPAMLLHFSHSPVPACPHCSGPVAPSQTTPSCCAPSHPASASLPTAEINLNALISTNAQLPVALLQVPALWTTPVPPAAPPLPRSHSILRI